MNRFYSRQRAGIILPRFRRFGFKNRILSNIISVIFTGVFLATIRPVLSEGKQGKESFPKQLVVARKELIDIECEMQNLNVKYSSFYRKLAHDLDELISHHESYCQAKEKHADTMERARLFADRLVKVAKEVDRLREQNEKALNEIEESSMRLKDKRFDKIRDRDYMMARLTKAISKEHDSLNRELVAVVLQDAMPVPEWLSHSKPRL